MPKTWFTITAKSADTAEIDLFDEIGGWGISAKQFIEQLRAAGQFKNIAVNIDSPGGDCNEGFTIFDGLKATKATITVNITGMAASMASVIMLAGDKIRIAENGRVMIHRVTGAAWGNADEMDAATKVLKQFEDRIVALYVERTGKTETEVRDMMKAQMGTWFFGAEAVEAGFADEVIKGAKARAFKNEWAHLFTMLPAALFDTSEAPNPKTSPPPNTPMNKLFFALATLAGITIKGDETEDQLETLIKNHKPAPRKFEMNLEDPETKKLFDGAVNAGITAALPDAIKNATKPLEDKITAQATEITNLKALIEGGAAGGARGAPPIGGSGGGDGGVKTMPRSQFLALDHPARNQFIREGGKLTD